MFVYCLKPKNKMFFKRFEESFALEKDQMGAALSFLGQKLFASSRWSTQNVRTSHAALLKHEFLDGGADDVTLATLTTLGNFLGAVSQTDL